MESSDDFFTARGRDNVPLITDGSSWDDENSLRSSDGLGLETGDSVNIAPSRNMFFGSFDWTFPPLSSAEFEEVAILGRVGSLLDAEP